MTQTVIIGEPGDPHVVSVLERMNTQPLVFDAQSLRDRPFVMDGGSITVDVAGVRHSFGMGAPARGWIRRIVPDSWLRSVSTDSLAAAEASGWMSLLAATLQLPETAWLSPIGAITRAENKLTQADVAARVGVRTPRTVVTNDQSRLPRDLEDELVVKPLGVGHYVEDGKPHVVHATAVSAHQLTTRDLAVAPFLIQEKLHARRHWRVVTVADEAWSAALHATGHPLDWRRSPGAHHSFKDEYAPVEIQRSARDIASELHLGYSSQDWIETDDAVYLLDVNPSGQWLFLPDRIGDAVARAIAKWMEKGGEGDG